MAPQRDPVLDAAPGRWRGVGGAIRLAAILDAAMAAAIGMPFNVEAVASRFGGSNGDYGTLAAIELLAVAAGSLAGARLAACGPRPIALGAMLLVLLANIVATMAGSIGALMAIRLAAGLGGGVVIAVVMFAAGRSDRPHIVFGILNSSVGVLGIVISFALSRLVAAHDILGAYGTYAALALLSLPAIATLSVGRSTGETESVAGGPLGLWRWVPLLGIGIVFLGHSALAVFIVRIGVGTGVAMATLGYVFVAISGLSVLLPMISAVYGVRMAPLPLVAGLLGLLAVAANVMANAGDLAVFALGCTVYAVLPTAMMPVVLTTFARRDPSGRLTGTHPAFVTFGGAVAPLISGRIVDLGGYGAVAWMSSLCFLLGGTLLAGTLRSPASEARPEEAPGPIPAPGAGFGERSPDIQ